MRNSYVYRVIDTFSSEEMDAFRLFLNSPYFNNGAHAKQHIALFQEFEANKQGPEPRSKQEFYKKLFPDGPFVEGKLDKLISEFKKLLHTFLLSHRYLQDKNQGEHALTLAMELRERGLEDKYKPALERARKIADADAQESLEAYWLQFKVAEEKHEWDSTHNKQKGDLNLPELISAFDKYYFAYRLGLLNYLLLLQKSTILPSASTIHIDKSWEVPTSELEASNLLLISWELYTILKSPAPNTDDFERMGQLLQAHGSSINPVHLKEFHTYLRNLCAFLIDMKNLAEFRPVLFQMQVEHLAKGYLYYDGKIHSNAMLSITNNALSVQAIPWAKDFVERHKNLIADANETQDIYRLNKALCLFAEKNYDAALDTIPFGSSYTYFHLFAHRLELKIYFEQNADLLPYKIDAFKMLIRRAGNKVLSKHVYEQHLNFVNLLRQLSLFPKTKDPAKAERLIQRINAKELVADRAWLMEKVRAFAGKG